jgi:hypothetical protein
MRNVIVMIVVAGLFLAIERFGGATTIGADPYWSKEVVYMGIGAGILLTVLGYAAIQFLDWDRGRVVGLFLLLGVIVMIVTINGRSGAAGGANALAAQVWQIGFVAAVAAWYASIVGAMSR